MPVGGHNRSPLVEIGLTDLPKFGCAMAIHKYIDHRSISLVILTFVSNFDEMFSA